MVKSTYVSNAEFCLEFIGDIHLSPTLKFSSNESFFFKACDFFIDFLLSGPTSVYESCAQQEYARNKFEVTSFAMVGRFKDLNSRLKRYELLKSSEINGSPCI